MDEKDELPPPTRVEAFLRDHPTIEPKNKGHGPHGLGKPVVHALTEIAALAESTGTTVRIEEIKEKFGGHCMYVFVDEPSSTGFELVENAPGHSRFRLGAAPGSVRGSVLRIVDAATDRVPHVCIRCGEPATKNLGVYRFCGHHTSVYE